jgi:hypothetical protein
VPYVAACVLRIAGARVEPGTDITSAVSAWCESAVRTSIAAGTVVFIPPQLLVLDGGALASSPDAAAIDTRGSPKKTG